MRGWRSAAVLLIIFVFGVRMSPQVSASPEDEIRSVMAQIRAASLEGDSEKVSILMADEYLQTDISGHVQDKRTWLREYFNPLAELIKAGKYRWEIYDRKDVQLRIYGESAVAIGSLEA
jgi:hypothetical protein